MSKPDKHLGFITGQWAKHHNQWQKKHFYRRIRQAWKKLLNPK